MQIRALFINGALHSINIYSNIGERDKIIQIFLNGAGEAYLCHISGGKDTTAYQVRDMFFLIRAS